MVGVDLPADVLDEERQVLAPLPERRDAEDDPPQAEVEVLAEAAGPRVRQEVAVGRGDHPDVDAGRAGRPDRPDLAAREEPEQGGLRLGGELADLVEEDRAAVGGGEQAGPPLHGAGEGAALVPEELRAEQLARQARRS